METTPREVRVFIHGWNPDTKDGETLASASFDAYTVENLQIAISEALESAGRSFGREELPLWQPQVSVWLRSNRGLRARMQLSQDLIGRIAAAGASVDFDPYMYEGSAFLLPNVGSTLATIPELGAMITCMDASGGANVLASTSYDQYTFENVEAAISSMIETARGALVTGSDCSPKVTVRPMLQREDRASMHFSASLVCLLAGVDASLDFDPSVCEKCGT